MDMTVQKDYGTTLQDMKSRMQSIKRKNGVSQSKKTKKKKKNLKYNAREISGQLLRSVKSVSAGQVLIRAKGKVAQLQRCAATGDYDERAVSAALNHAKRMVKAAKMKVKHLKSEERLEKKGKKRKPQTHMRVEQKEKQLLQQELKKIRRKHRGAEEGDRFHNEKKTNHSTDFSHRYAVRDNGSIRRGRSSGKNKKTEINKDEADRLHW